MFMMLCFPKWHFAMPTVIVQAIQPDGSITPMRDQSGMTIRVSDIVKSEQVADTVTEQELNRMNMGELINMVDTLKDNFTVMGSGKKGKVLKVDYVKCLLKYWHEWFEGSDKEEEEEEEEDENDEVDKTASSSWEKDASKMTKTETPTDASEMTKTETPKETIDDIPSRFNWKSLVINGPVFEGPDDDRHEIQTSSSGVTIDFMKSSDIPLHATATCYYGIHSKTKFKLLVKNFIKL